MITTVEEFAYELGWSTDEALRICSAAGVTLDRGKYSLINEHDRVTTLVYYADHPEAAKAGRGEAIRALLSHEILIDGLNVAFWRQPGLSLVIPLAVAHQVAVAGGQPILIFDASARHRLPEIEVGLYEIALAQCPDRLVEAPGRIRADDVLLMRATDKGGSIISNDQYRDYGSRFPTIVGDEGRLIKGAVVSNVVYLPTLNLTVSIDHPVEIILQNLLDQFTR